MSLAALEGTRGGLNFTTMSHDAEPVIVRGVATLWNLARFLRDPIRCGGEVFARHGSLVVFEPFGPLPRRTTILAVGPKFNGTVLGNPQVWHTRSLTQRGPQGSALNRLGRNLVSMNGAAHAYYRKLLSQPLQRSSVNQLGVDIGRLVMSEVASWPQETVVDLWPLAKRLMRSTAVALLFGGDQARGTKLGDLIEDLMIMNMSASARLCHTALPGSSYQRMLKQAESIERCTLEFAATRRDAQTSSDLLSMIVNSPDESGAIPTNDSIAGHIPILFASTYETCQTVLTWTLFLLAQHPRVASNLVEEISGALGQEPPSLSRVESLPLLEAVIKESMRILPPVPYQVRAASKPTRLGAYDVATGAHVIISPFLTNRSKDLYDEPDCFRPERWAQITPSAFEYLTFSAGPRACPGYLFGMGIVKVAIASILTRFRVSIVPGSRIDCRAAVTMRPQNGLAAVLHPPDGKWSSSPVTGQIREMVNLPPANVH